MSSFIRLIVGLGNPGPEYAKTRHNVGYWFLDELADATHVNLQPNKRFFGELGRLRIGELECWLLKPATFMNLSGRAVVSVTRFYDISVEGVLVVHDDIDLAPGVVRVKCGGGHGGHNGLRDIVQHLGSGFLRLRFGVGHPGVRDQVTPYVLGRPSAQDEEAIQSAVGRSLELLPDLLRGECQKVMNVLHRDNVTDSTPNSPA